MTAINDPLTDSVWICRSVKYDFYKGLSFLKFIHVGLSVMGILSKAQVELRYRCSNNKLILRNMETPNTIINNNNNSAFCKHNERAIIHNVLPTL